MVLILIMNDLCKIHNVYKCEREREREYQKIDTVTERGGVGAKLSAVIKIKINLFGAKLFISLDTIII